MLAGCCGEEGEKDLVEDLGEEGVGRIAVLEQDLVAEQVAGQSGD